MEAVRFFVSIPDKNKEKAGQPAIVIPKILCHYFVLPARFKIFSDF